MNTQRLLADELDNPLDSIEDVLLDQDWVFTRHDDNALSVHITGQYGEYTLGFVWQSEYDAMQMTCEYDLDIGKERQALLDTTLRLINRRLWLGLFETANDNASPRFRHTCLMRGWSHDSSSSALEDLVEIALAECEKHYHVFSLVASKMPITEDTIALALQKQAGRA